MVMRALAGVTDLEAALRAERALIYKHSSSCAISSLARLQVGHFADEYPDLPVYVLDLVEHRDLSDLVTERTGIAHESPQAIMLRDGEPVAQLARMGIRAEKLAQALAETRG